MLPNWERKERKWKTESLYPVTHIYFSHTVLLHTLWHWHCFSTFYINRFRPHTFPEWTILSVSHICKCNLISWDILYFIVSHVPAEPTTHPALLLHCSAQTTFPKHLQQKGIPTLAWLKEKHESHLWEICLVSSGHHLISLLLIKMHLV